MRISPHDINDFTARGWWGDETVGRLVARQATERPKGVAFVDDTSVTTWLEYNELADRIALNLLSFGLGANDRVGVLLPDGGLVHAVYVACERIGAVIVGLGTRAGDRELAHLLDKTSARAVITGPSMNVAGTLHSRLASMKLRNLELHLEVGRTGTVTVDPIKPMGVRVHVEARPLGANDLFLLNSTSGTTGLPKCVTQFQNRWFFFHQLAQDSADLHPDDVFMSLVPSPFGFGLWTAHFTPAILGAPTVVMERFEAERAIQRIIDFEVTVLCCVSTQFLMMLTHESFDALRSAPLRAMFTGGESVPPQKATEFEVRSGAAVLQFFGSNETGAFSRTTLRHSREQRLTTAGEIVPEMNVRLFDDSGNLITEDGVPGQPGGHGPAMCGGYFEDDQANAELYTDDGWMLMGDFVTIDHEGFLRVVGRKADFIIRGGKNISAAEVEDLLCSHPSVALAAVVPVPDEIFGERIGVVIETIPGAVVDLNSLIDHFRSLGVSKELTPELLVLVEELPRSSGGKVAKGELRKAVDRLFPPGSAPG